MYENRFETSTFPVPGRFVGFQATRGRVNRPPADAIEAPRQ